MAEEQKPTIRGIETVVSQRFSQTPSYAPTDHAGAVIARTRTRFSSVESTRDQSNRWLGRKHDGSYRTLLEYVDVSNKRWNSQGIPRTELEPWQASVFKPETRNKIIAILSAVGGQRPRARFRSVNDTGNFREEIMTHLYDWTMDYEDGDEKAFYTMLDALREGTAIRYEGFREEYRTIKEISSINPRTGEVNFTEKTVVKRCVYTADVKLQDFYPGDISKRRMEDQPDAFWRRVMSYNDFMAEFKGYENAKYVLAGGDITDQTFFSSYTSDIVRDPQSDLVEVLFYYNPMSDEYIILANGVWVNPIGNDTICPLPFHHKMLPFWKIVFEPFASDYFYGKSAPDKLLHEQDAINAMYNMMIDQGFISVHAPILNANPDAIDDVDLVPGKMNYVGGDMQKIKVMEFPPPNPAHFNLLALMQKSLDQTSAVSPVQMGDVGGGDTATEVRAAQSAASRIFSLFLVFVYHGYRRQGQLRSKNIMQFMMDSNVVERIIGEGKGEKVKEAYGSYRLNGVTLSSGQTGSKVIEVVDRKTLDERMNSRFSDRQKMKAKGVERISITPDYIRNSEYDVMIEADSTVKETPTIRRAMAMEFTKTVLAYFPDQADRNALYADILEVFDKDPEKYTARAPAPQPMMPGRGMTGGDTSAPSSTGQQMIERATGQAPLGGVSTTGY